MSCSKWWHKSWNPVVGCSETSPGCTNCYAARLASTRLAHTPRYQGLTYNGRWNGSLRTTGAKCPTVRNGELLFVCDMGDLFHDGVGEAEAGAIIRQALDATTTFGSFALLTKRAPTMRRVALATFDADHPPRQAWLGVTAEDQLRHDARVPVLRGTPAGVRFLSCEPLLGIVQPDLRGIDWVIVGGEAGPGARRCSVEWISFIVDQCRAAGVPCFVKQLGSAACNQLGKLKLRDSRGADWLEWPDELRVRELPSPARGVLG